jgi:hypothetical protein
MKYKESYKKEKSSDYFVKILMTLLRKKFKKANEKSMKFKEKKINKKQGCFIHKTQKKIKKI